MTRKRTTRTSILFMLALGLLLVGSVQAMEPRAPGTVAVTWQLTVNGTVPAGEFLYVEYSPRSGAPDDDGFAHFCGQLFQIDTKPACQGNGTVYTETVSFPIGTTITFSFERSNQSTSTGGGDPYEIEVIQQGSRLLNADVTISATYAYKTVQVYVPLVRTAPPPTAAVRGTLAFTRDGDIYGYNLGTKQTRLLITNGRDMQYSPDGTQLAFVRANGVYLARADGTNIRRIAALDEVHTPRWSDNNTKLVWERASNEIWTVALPNGTPTKIATGSDPAWAPDSLRVTYVTAPTGSANRNELRLTNWQGQNGWNVVTTIPPNTPSIGIPGNKVSRDNLDHRMVAPVWNAQGSAIYAPAFVLYQALSDFFIWERADATNGGSVFLSELPAVDSATASPNRQSVVFESTTASGATSLLARSLDPTVPDSSYVWVERRATPGEEQYEAPAWSPDSNAVATLRCGGTCDLVVLAPGQAEPQVLVTNLSVEEDTTLAWGRNE